MSVFGRVFGGSQELLADDRVPNVSLQQVIRASPPSRVELSQCELSAAIRVSARTSRRENLFTMKPPSAVWHVSAANTTRILLHYKAKPF
jgi:hypothetical protein